MLQLDSGTLVDLVDSSYEMARERKAWASGIVTTLFQITTASFGGAFDFTWQYENGLLGVRTCDPIVEQGSTTLRSGSAFTGMLNAPPELREPIWGRTYCTVLSQVGGLGSELQRMPGWRDCWDEPISDCLALTICDASGKGFCAAVGLNNLESLTPRQSRLLGKVAMHIASGDRLRRAKQRDLIDHAEAILSPTGNVLHAVNKAKDNRDSIDDGRRRRDEARRTKHDAEKALEVWQGLVAGRWSLIDHFDTDGKRFLLAIKNTPRVGPRIDLTPRERRVCALVAMGHRDKEVAYMLGLSIAAVVASLRRARIKLKVSSRAELVAAWRQESNE